MPRLLMQSLDVHDPLINQSVAGIESAMMSYVVATNPLGFDADLETRCVIGGVVWALYLRYLQNGGRRVSTSGPKPVVLPPAVPSSHLTRNIPHFRKLPWQQ
jgi:hypothetical protein